MILLLGKSASGKDTIQKELIKMGMNSVVSYTTRPMRVGEREGIEYHFITKEEFFKKEKEGFFAETTSYNVATGETWYYGSAIEDLTDDKVVIVNPDGYRQIKKIKSLNPVSFLLNVDKNILWTRLQNRGDNLEEAKRRLIADDNDFEGLSECVDFVLRNDLGVQPKYIADMILYAYNMTTNSKEE